MSTTEGDGTEALEGGQGQTRGLAGVFSSAWVGEAGGAFWGAMGLTYLVVAALIAQQGGLPNVVRAFLALPALLLVPQQVGLVVLGVLGRTGWELDGHMIGVGRFVVAWLVGTYVLLVSVAGLIGLGWWWLPGYLGALTAVLLGRVGYRLWLSGKSVKATALPSSRPVINPARWGYLSAIALGLTPILLIKAVQPFPLAASYGLFNYSYHALRFTELGILEMAPFRHTPIQPLLSGLASVAFNISPFALYWVVPVLLYPLFALGIYLFVLEATQQRLVAILAAFFGVWILSLQIFQHLHAFIERSLLLTLFPFALLLVERVFLGQSRAWRHHLLAVIYTVGISLAFFLGRNLVGSQGQGVFVFALPLPIAVLALTLKGQGRSSFVVLSLVAASFLLIHVFEGLIFLAVLLAHLAARRLAEARPWGQGLLLGLLALGGAFVALQVAKVVTFPDYNLLSNWLFAGRFSSSFVDLPFDSKIERLRAGLGDPLLALLLLSTLYLVWRREARNLSLLAVGGFSLVAYLLPESRMHRAVGAGLPFIAAVLALGVVALPQTLLSRFRLPRRRSLALALSGLLVLGLVPTVTASLRYQISPALGSPEVAFSWFDLADYEASEWILTHLPQEAVVVSDPYTMFIVQGLTLRDQLLPERQWVWEEEYSPRSRAIMKRLKERVFRARDAAAAYAELRRLGADAAPFYMVVNSRTRAWVEQEGYGFLRSSALTAMDVEAFPPLLDEAYFRPIHQVERKGYVFEVAWPGGLAEAAQELERQGDREGAIALWDRLLALEGGGRYAELARGHLAQLTTFDFLAALDTATVSSPNPDWVHRDRFNLNGDLRNIIFAHAPSTIRYQGIAVPVGARLRFGIGIDPNLWGKGEAVGDGVTFEVRLEDAEGDHLLFSRYSDPKSRPEEGRWFDEELDLAAYAGERVSISFVTLPGPLGDSRLDWAGWSRPHLGGAQLDEVSGGDGG